MAMFRAITSLVLSLVLLTVRADDFNGKELEFPEPKSPEEVNPPYATVNGFTMPAFQDATLCWRLKTSVTDGRVSIFSYAVEDSDNEFSAEINLNKNVLFFFKNDKEFGIDLSKSDFKNNEWSQMCLVWDNKLVKPTLLVGNFGNGQVTSNEMTEQAGKPEADADVVGGGAVVIGQDQDDVMGGFQAKDGMKGTIGNVQLFKRKFTVEDASQQMKCTGAPEGDILAWSNSGYTAVNDVAVVSASAPCVQ